MQEFLTKVSYIFLTYLILPNDRHNKTCCGQYTFPACPMKHTGFYFDRHIFLTTKMFQSHISPLYSPIIRFRRNMEAICSKNKKYA
jgi:hypothetical protein